MSQTAAAPSPALSPPWDNALAYVAARPGRSLILTLSAVALVTLTWLASGEPFVGVAVAALPIALVVVMRIPFQLCLLFLMCSFFRLPDLVPGLSALKLPKMLALATLFVMGCWAVAGRVKTFWRREFTVLIVLFIHVTISMLLSGGRDNAMAYWSDTYSKIILMVFIIAYLCTTPVRFMQAGAAMIISGIIVSFQAIYNSLNGIGLVEGTRVTIGRDIGSVLGDPNDLSLVLLFPMSFAAAFVVAPKLTWMSRLLGAFGFVIVLWAVLCTQSRGGLFGIVAILAILGLRVIKSKVLLLAIGGIALMGLFAAAGISGRSSGGAGEDGIDASAEGRLFAWQAAFDMARDHPMLGVGIDCFRANYYLYTPHWEGIAKAVHSTWFAAMAETGFLGFSIFLTLVISMLRLSLRTLKHLDRQRKAGIAVEPQVLAIAIAMPAGIISFMISGSFLTQAFTWPIYILLSLTTAVAQYASRRR